MKFFFNLLILASSVMMAYADHHWQQAYEHPQHTQWSMHGYGHQGADHYKRNYGSYPAHYPTQSYGTAYKPQPNYGTQYQGHYAAAAKPTYGTGLYRHADYKEMKPWAEKWSHQPMVRSAAKYETIPVANTYHHKSYQTPKTLMMANPLLANPLMLGGAGIGGLYPTLPLSTTMMLNPGLATLGTGLGALGYGGLGLGGLGTGYGLGLGGLGTELFYAKNLKKEGAADHRLKNEKSGFQGRSLSSGSSYQYPQTYGVSQMQPYGHGIKYGSPMKGIDHSFYGYQPSMTISGYGMGSRHGYGSSTGGYGEIHKMKY